MTITLGGMTVDLLSMAHNYADARFGDLDLDTRSQWISRGTQYLSYGIQTAHDGRLMHDIYNYAHVRFDDFDLFFDVYRLVHLVLFAYSSKLRPFPRF